MAEHKSSSETDSKAKPAKPPDDKPADVVVQPDEGKELAPVTPATLSPADAHQHLRAGTKLRKAGDPPEKWLCGVRGHDQVMVGYPLTPELEEELIKSGLVVAE